jgi:hypothetical protein
MRTLDLAQCTSPESVVEVLRQAAEQYAQDAGEMDATAFLDGRCWDVIARELERTADRIITRCSKRGYPFLKRCPHCYKLVEVGRHSCK